MPTAPKSTFIPFFPTPTPQEEEVPSMNVFQELDKIIEMNKEMEEKIIKENKEMDEKQAMIQAIKEKKAKQKLNVDLYCNSCDLTFNSETVLNEHMVQYNKVHSKVYKCRYCEVTSVGTRNFKEHLVSHKNEKKERLSQNSE